MLELKIAVLCFGVGLFLQTIGFVCPGWKIIRVGKARVNMALRYSLVCIHTEKVSNAEMNCLCDTRSYYMYYMFNLDGDLMSRAGQYCKRLVFCSKVIITLLTVLILQNPYNVVECPLYVLLSLVITFQSVILKLYSLDQ